MKITSEMTDFGGLQVHNVHVSEDESREAVSQWLEAKGAKIAPTDLTPSLRDDANNSWEPDLKFDGFTFKIEGPLPTPKPGKDLTERMNADRYMALLEVVLLAAMDKLADTEGNGEVEAIQQKFDFVSIRTLIRGQQELRK